MHIMSNIEISLTVTPPPCSRPSWLEWSFRGGGSGARMAVRTVTMRGRTERPWYRPMGEGFCWLDTVHICRGAIDEWFYSCSKSHGSDISLASYRFIVASIKIVAQLVLNCEIVFDCSHGEPATLRIGRDADGARHAHVTRPPRFRISSSPPKTPNSVSRDL